MLQNRNSVKRIDAVGKLKFAKCLIHNAPLSESFTNTTELNQQRIVSH